MHSAVRLIAVSINQTLHRFSCVIIFLKRKMQKSLSFFSQLGFGKGNQMRSPSCPKIRIFDLEGLRDTESKNILRKEISIILLALGAVGIFLQP